MTNQPGQNALIVPIEINALYLESEQTVMDAKADFSRLPWSNGQEDFNADTPFLGEAVLSPPFQNKNFTMAAGLHLHWVLPRAFRTYPTTDSTGNDNNGAKKDPYPVPNRWLIKNTTTQNEWVVESDYMNTEITAHNKDAVTVPVIVSQLPADVVPKPTPNPQPFRYLGRQVLSKNWPTTEPDPNASYWSDEHGGKELTAFGYGEMAFNTFYPNCRSVFGFFDPSPGDITNGVEYEVLGWYAPGSNDDISNDILCQALKELSDLIGNPIGNPALLRKMFDDGGTCPTWLSSILTPAPTNPPWGDHVVTTKTYKNLLALLLDNSTVSQISLHAILNLDADAGQQFLRFGLKQMLNWEVSGTGTSLDSSTRSLYYSTITVNSDSSDQYTFDNVAVGNSASEAISAYLGQAMKPDAGDLKTVETQLNAILHGSNFQGNLTDAQLNFKEAVHASGFEPKQSGSLWRVRKMQLPETDASPGQQPAQQGQGQVTLPEDFAGLLNELNLAQSEYDKGQEDIETLQNEIYANWSKYIMVAYPPLGTHMDLPDQDFVKAYVDWQCSELSIMQERVGTFVAGGTADQSTGLLGTKLYNAYQAVQNYLNNPQSGQTKSVNEEAKAEGYEFELSVVPAPRYYKPKDPVLVFSSTDASPSLADPKAPLPVLWADSLTLASSDLPFKLSDVSGIATPSGISNFTSQQQKSLPQILEWAVDYYPVQNGNNLTTGSGDYLDTFLASPNFNFKADDFDFEVNEIINDSPNSYAGSTYIATNPESHILDSLQTFLLGRYAGLTKDDFNSVSDLHAAWGKLTGPPTDYTDPGYTAYMAYTTLSGKYFVAQSIGGFNQALIQFVQNVQLPIMDPLGFKDYDTFVDHVKSALKNVNPPSSNPYNLFVPLRAGALNLTDVKLVDHFGRGTSPANLSSPIVASSLDMTINDSWWWMGPRFSQESRLNFRWLAADAPTGETDIEMNSHPASSPVCGWILPNYLDQSLVFYNQDGKGLGSIHQEDGKWHHFPGSVNPISITVATTTAPTGVNGHLFKVIHRLLNWVAGDNNTMTPSSTAPFMQAFISNIENAQNTIYPENYAGHEALSILIGKPIAVVRGTINLEAKGGVIADQGWIPFSNQLQGARPQTDGYEHVNVPINLGDPHQLNDGLIAYWQEDDTGNLGSNLTVITTNSQTSTIEQTLASEPVNLTMLVDPHGVIHASSGVLPVKVIDIPSDQYTKALKNIEVAFFSAPLLTGTQNIQLSIPKESGYQWTWLQQNSGTGGAPTWQHIPNVPLVSENDLNTAWANLVSSLSIYPLPAKPLIGELTSKNWLGADVYPGTDFYQVMLPDKRQALDASWAKYQTQIEEILFKNLRGVTPYNTNAQFENQHLLEGWLLLTNDQSTNTQEG